MAESRIVNSTKNITSGLLSRLFTLLIQFGSRTIFIYVLGEECLGLNGLFTSLLSLVSLAELGIGQAITFYMYKPIAEQNITRLSQLVKFYKLCYRIIGISIGVIGLAVVPLLPHLIDFEKSVGYNTTLLYLIYLANTAITYLFFSYPQTVLAANQKQYIVTNCSLIFSLISFAAESIVLFLTRNYVAYLCVKMILGVVMNCCIAIIAFAKYPYLKTRHVESIRWSEVKEMFKDIYAIFVVKLSAQLFTSTDNIFISAMFGTVLVGYNSNYVMIISAITGIVSTCIYSCTGSVGNLVASCPRDVVHSRFKFMDYVNFCISGFCAVCLFSLLNPFISLVWGSEMLFSPFAVAMMCLNFYIVSSLSTLFLFREGMGLFQYHVYNQLIAAGANIALNIILGKLIGIEGIFVATVVANCCFAVIPFVKNLFSVGFSMSHKQYVWNMLLRLLLVVGIAAVVNLVCSKIPDTFGGFVFRCMIVASVSGLGILLTGIKNNQLRTIVSYAQTILKRKG